MILTEDLRKGDKYMAKGDKEFYWRMEGMVYAHKIAKEQGIEALEGEIKARNILKASIEVNRERLEELYTIISTRIYNNMLTMAYAALHDTFGFRKDRLKRFKKAFDEKTMLVADLTRFGNHYATFTDYAVEANEKYDLGINIDLVSSVQDCNDETIGKRARIDAIEKLLEQNGFTEASQFLKDYEFTKMG
jgi:hypothetical protein